MNHSHAAPRPWSGKWALVTGASSGIGAELAKELARDGSHLLLTARRQDRLTQLAEGLSAEYGIQTRTFAADLIDPAAPQQIFEFANSQDIEIDLLVNNAGYGIYGEFYASPLGEQLGMVQLHCAVPLALTHLFLKGMVERKRGFLLFLATTAVVPAPYVSVYAASKAFEQLFAEGLAEEVERYGIRVAALCPGPTATEMNMSSEPASAKETAGLQSAAAVARKALAGLSEGQRCIRPSLLAKITANLPRFLPRATVSGGAERHYRPKHLA